MSHPGTGKYERLLERCKGLPPIPTAVAYPCEETALEAAVDAGKQGLITPILVGPVAKIGEIAKAHKIDLSGIEIVDVASTHASAAKAVELVRHGRAERVTRLRRVSPCRSSMTAKEMPCSVPMS